ncbi:hypothetical protein [Parvibaculum sp.]|uniref:hypothetical protein n=1 Tax=Parvibaculum sp. TaxID=2024848 RepID=UPI0025EAD096|nr:hypothetical protein [Parvibaculum sp.]
MLLVAACGPKLEELSPANLNVYPVKQVAAKEHATIQGSFEDTSVLIWKSSRATYVGAIDGQIETSAVDASIPIAPGPHAVLIGYWVGAKQIPVPVRLDAEAGKKYIVVEEDGPTTMDNLLDSQKANYLSIVDQATGEAVVPKISDMQSEASSYYVEPTEDDSATIRGSKKTNVDVYRAYVVTVDGKYVKPLPGSFMSAPHPDYEAALRLAPGLHAIGVGFGVNMNQSGAFAYLLDVKPSAHYVVRFDHGVQRIGDQKWWTYTLWLEDEKTGAVVIPKTDLPLQKLPF